MHAISTENNNKSRRCVFNSRWKKKNGIFWSNDVVSSHRWRPDAIKMSHFILFNGEMQPSAAAIVRFINYDCNHLRTVHHCPSPPCKLCDRECMLTRIHIFLMRFYASNDHSPHADWDESTGFNSTLGMMRFACGFCDSMSFRDSFRRSEHVSHS